MIVESEMITKVDSKISEDRLKLEEVNSQVSSEG